MFNYSFLTRYEKPFPHWVGNAVAANTVRAINKAWPDDKKDWYCERGVYVRKDALMFPKRLPEPAQKLAEDCYSPEMLFNLSLMTGLTLEPDPWFLKGPLKPALGGGLHEIHNGGLLKMHIDFNKHPTGKVRVLNLLIYLNEVWNDEWGGALELGNDRSKRYIPYGGRVVMFETTATSWHGHPVPLACPKHITRRSLALYYYKQSGFSDRPTTVYMK